MKVHANGIDIHYAISGNGPWVTLSHSLFCDGSMSVSYTHLTLPTKRIV